MQSFLHNARKQQQQQQQQQHQHYIDKKTCCSGQRVGLTLFINPRNSALGYIQTLAKPLLNAVYNQKSPF